MQANVMVRNCNGQIKKRSDWRRLVLSHMKNNFQVPVVVQRRAVVAEEHGRGHTKSMDRRDAVGRCAAALPGHRGHRTSARAYSARSTDLLARRRPQLRIWSYDRWRKPQQQQLGEVWRYDAFPNSLTEVNGVGHVQIPEYHNWEDHCRGNRHMDLGNLGGQLTPTKDYSLIGESADSRNHTQA